MPGVFWHALGSRLAHLAKYIPARETEGQSARMARFERDGLLWLFDRAGVPVPPFKSLPFESISPFPEHLRRVLVNRVAFLYSKIGERRKAGQPYGFLADEKVAITTLMRVAGIGDTSSEPKPAEPMKISLSRETSAELALLWTKGSTVAMLAAHFKTSDAAIVAGLRAIGFSVSMEIAKDQR